MSEPKKPQPSPPQKPDRMNWIPGHPDSGRKVNNNNVYDQQKPPPPPPPKKDK